jgi:hypothetical protein
MTWRSASVSSRQGRRLGQRGSSGNPSTPLPLVPAGKEVYVDIAGWHLFLRDMSAAPGLKMNEALATQLGPKVRRAATVPGSRATALQHPRLCPWGGVAH